MNKEGIESICPRSIQAWRRWLQKNHNSKKSVWLIYYKKESGKPTFSWSDAVDEALCFGWIDSIRKSIDDKRFIQFFSKRKAKSTWSKVNKENIQRLIAAGSMTQAGLESVWIAKQNGSWSILDEVEELLIPLELKKEFKTKKGSKEYFESLSKSVQKAILQWIVLARQTETRQRRINEIAECAAQGLKPKQFR